MLHNSPVGVNVDGIVGGRIRQQEGRRDYVLALHRRQNRVTWHQVLHRGARGTARMHRLNYFQAFAANLKSDDFDNLPFAFYRWDYRSRGLSNSEYIAGIGLVHVERIRVGKREEISVYIFCITAYIRSKRAQEEIAGNRRRSSPLFPLLFS